MPSSQSFRLRRGTAAQWTAANPILAQGEPGYATDTTDLRIGDGTTAWNSLPSSGGPGAFISRASRTKHAPALGLYFPEAEGAVADGVTLDTAAIQAAINTACASGSGARVHLGAATYNTGPLTIPSPGVTIEGVGPHLSTLQTATGDLLTTPAATTLTRLEIRDVRLSSTAGGGHILVVPYGVNQSTFKRVRFTQSNNAKSILTCDRTGATNGGLFDNHFVDCHFVMPTTATAYGFDVKGDGNVASANLWQRCRAEGGGTYMFNIETLLSGSWCYNNTWDAINFEFTDHGAIRLRSAMNATISNIGFFDNGTIDAALINIGCDAGANKSRGNRISSVHRSSGTLSGSGVDVRLVATGNGGTTVIEAVSGPTPAGVTVDLGSGDGYAVVLGHDPTQATITNANSARTVIITSDNGAQVPALTVAGVQFLSGSSYPEGAITGNPGDLYQRLIGTGGVGQSRLFIKETGTATNTGWRAVNVPATSTTAALASATNAINTGGKVAGVLVFNTTTNKPVWATGSTATSTWVSADGTTAHTPV